MPHPRPNRLLTVLLLLPLLAVPAMANDDHHGGHHIHARLIGFQEVPAVSTVASGEFKATIAPDDQSIEYELTYSGLQGTVQQAHIHVAQRSVNGSIVILLCGPAAALARSPAPYLSATGSSATSPRRLPCEYGAATLARDAVRDDLGRLPRRSLLAAARALHRERLCGPARPHALCHRRAEGVPVGDQERRDARAGERHGIGRTRVCSRPDPPLRSHGRDRALRRRQARDPPPHRPRAAPAGPGPRRRPGRGALRNPRHHAAPGRPRGRRRGHAYLQRVARRLL